MLPHYKSTSNRFLYITSAAMEQQYGFVPPPETSPKHVRRRLIVCCDGTWQDFNHTPQDIKSHLAKLVPGILKNLNKEQNLLCPRLVCFDASVATADPFHNKVAGQYLLSKRQIVFCSFNTSTLTLVCRFCIGWTSKVPMLVQFL